MATVIERFWAKVNRRGDDECWEWMAALDGVGYGKIKIGGRSGRFHSAHRLSYEINVGPIPEGLQIDHTCFNRACVNPRHLRICTKSQNAMNTKRLQLNRSGFKGVSRFRNTDMWQSRIQKDGKCYFLGVFVDPEQAHRAYCEAAAKLFGEFANSGDAA